jgi:exonuclease SbcC
MGRVQVWQVQEGADWMIKDLHIQDFIAHKDTRIEFGKGITIFVGHNGSGKSSVIDAITYALFGEHTRRSSKNLVRRGARQGSVQMRFSMNSREYSATRMVGGQDPRSQLTLLSDAGSAVNRPIVGGERRQFGESMSREVARILGLDYDRMCVAAVVQQGELSRIVNYAPKDFKELLNGLIGIEKLDRAYAAMKDVIGGFRDWLRSETGYTDEEIPEIEQLIAERESEKKQAELMLADFEREKELLEKQIIQIQDRIAKMEPLLQSAQELSKKERLLMRHASERRVSIEAEISRLERVAREARVCLQDIAGKEEVAMRMQMVKAETEGLQQKIEENEGMRGKLRGLLESAGRLQIVDGKCPVCSSPVSKLNSVFDVAHIRREIEEKEGEKSELQRSRLAVKKEEQELADRDRKISYADKFLRDNSIQSMDDILKMEEEIRSKKSDLGKLPKEITKVGLDPSELAIDGVSRSIAEEITQLRKQASSFSHHDYSNAKLERDSHSRKLQDTSRRIGIHQKTIEDAGRELDFARRAIDQLHDAAGFVRVLENIRASVFNRDGPIGTSLRSWAIRVISEKASDYASLFNIGISRIELAEKPREVDITCYGRHGEIDIDSLSGGEKVAVALALRLGIAYMMGSNKLDFVILDEPTTHLDEERRKALVRIISEAFREGAGPLSQLVIITHDSEIFEDADVDRIFRFSMTSEGSRVTQE